MMYLVAIAFEEGRRICIGVCSNLMRPALERRMQAPWQIEHRLQLGEQALDLAQLLNLVPP